MIFGHLYDFILIKQNWLTIKNKKLFLILYEKEEANWTSVAQHGVAHVRKRPTMGEPTHALAFLEKRPHTCSKLRHCLFTISFSL